MIVSFILSFSARFLPPTVFFLLLSVCAVSLAAHVHSDLLDSSANEKDGFKFQSLQNWGQEKTNLQFTKAAVQALFSPLFGLLSDYKRGGKGGRYRTVIASLGLLMLAISYGIGRTISAGSPALYVSEVLAGLGLAALLPTAASTMRRIAAKRGPARRHLAFGVFVGFSSFLPLMFHQTLSSSSSTLGTSIELSSLVLELALTAIPLALFSLFLITAAVIDANKEDLGQPANPSAGQAARVQGSDWTVSTFFSDSNPLLALLAADEGDDELLNAVNDPNAGLFAGDQDDEALNSLLDDYAASESSSARPASSSSSSSILRARSNQNGCCSYALACSLSLCFLVALSTGALSGAEQLAREFVNTSFDARLSFGFVSGLFSFATCLFLFPVLGRRLGSAPVLLLGVLLTGVFGAILPFTFPDQVSGDAGDSSSVPLRIGLAVVLALRSVGNALIPCSLLTLVNGASRSRLAGLSNGLSQTLQALGLFLGDVIGHELALLPVSISLTPALAASSFSFVLLLTVLGICIGWLRLADPRQPFFSSKKKRNVPVSVKDRVDSLFDL